MVAPEAELHIRPLLAHEPERRPPGRGWLFVLPLALGVLGLLLAVLFAGQGRASAVQAADQARALHEATLENQVHRAIAQARDPAQVIRLEDQLNDLRQRHALTRQSGQLLPETPAVLAYASILNHGYSFDPDAAGGKPKAAAGLPSNNLAWYPLFPLLASGVQMMTGVAAPTALAITARLCALLGAVVFFACARRHYFNRLPALEPTENLHVTLRWDLAPADTAALWATALLLFNPFSIFLYEPGADSLFVLLFASFLLLIQERWWLPAAVVAGLASAALPEGALFAPVLVLTYIFRSNSRTLARRTYEGVGLGVVALLGLGAFLLFLYAHFGTSGAVLEPLQIWTTGLDWASLSFALSPINALTQAFYYGFAPAPLDLPRLLAAWSVLVPPVLLMLLGARFLSFEQELLGWLLWVVPLISGVGPGYAGSAHWLSMGRVMAVALPLELIIGAVIVRFRWLGPCLLTASAGFFALFCYLAGAGVALG